MTQAFAGEYDGQFADLRAQIANLNSNDQRIFELLQLLTAQGATVMADLTALTSEVTNNTSVEQSAITLIQNIAEELQAAGTDPVALNALVQQLTANDTALAAAVTANTPAAPSPTS